MSCPPARNSKSGATACTLCPELHYGYTHGGNCSGRCAELELPRWLPPRVAAKTLQAALAQPASCAGGLPNAQAFILPMDGVWIHVGPTGAVELLACQTAPDGSKPGACESLPQGKNATEWRAEQNGANGLLSAVCGTGYAGFLCAKCIKGFKKISGDCLECVSFNWKALLQMLILNCCTCLFLLHKSMRPVISAEEIRLVWNKVDREEAGLSTAKVGVGFGRIVFSDIYAPIIVANLV